MTFCFSIVLRSFLRVEYDASKNIWINEHLNTVTTIIILKMFNWCNHSRSHSNIQIMNVLCTTWILFVRIEEIEKIEIETLRFGNLKVVLFLISLFIFFMFCLLHVSLLPQRDICVMNDVILSKKAASEKVFSLIIS
jgi:hypothetical protein